MQKGQRVPLNEVSNSFKEFLLIFFGASWSQQSITVADSLAAFLKEYNTQEYSRSIEFIYLGNDLSPEAQSEFIDKHLNTTTLGGY